MEKAFWIPTGRYKVPERKEKTADGQDLYPPRLPLFISDIFIENLLDIGGCDCVDGSRILGGPLLIGHAGGSHGLS